MAPVRRWSQLLGPVAYAMVYGLVHTAVIFIVLVLFFPQLDLSQANPATAATFMLLGSFSFVGIGMIAAILPLLYVERGAQMTFVLQSCLLLVSGVYYSVDDPAALDAGALAPVAGDLRPRRRAGRAHRRDARDRAARRRLAADRDGHRVHPVRPVGVRPRRALRQAHRQAEAGGLSMTMPGRRSRIRPPVPRLGRRLGRRPSCRSPAPAVARRGSSPSTRRRAIVRDERGVDRSAIVTGPLPVRGARARDYPAVGDWVALDESAAARPADDPAVISAVLPRRSAFRRSAADANRRTAGHLVDEQVIAANVDIAFLVAGLDGDFNLRRIERYLAVAWSSGVMPGRRAQQGRRRATTSRAGSSPSRRSRRACPIVTLSALTGDHAGRPRARTSQPGTTAVVLGSSGVGKSTLVNALLGEARQATADVREDDSRGRHTTTHRELFALPGGALLIDTPGHPLARGRRRRRGRRDRLRRHHRARRRRAGSATVATTASRAARSGPRSPTDASARIGWPATASSSASWPMPSARAIRAPGPAHEREWRLIHKSVNEHMDRKYGDDR